jgi:hypothetical protein
VELVQLAPGKSVDDVLAWVEKPAGAPPGMPLRGVSPCRPPHEHGMIQEFEVPAALSAR